MPSYRDKDSGRWFCKFNYRDYTGQRRQKKKRGFTTKREAQAWERDFLLRIQGKPEMTFESLYALYIEDLEPRIKKSTAESVKRYFRLYILPYFSHLHIIDIKPVDIRKWQSQHLAKSISQWSGEPLAPRTIRGIEERLSAIFNFAVKYYGLPSNPMQFAGHIAPLPRRQVSIWTPEQFKAFLDVVDEPQYHCLFSVLYYTGVRIGEALALTPADIDRDVRIIRINKNLVQVKGETYIDTPKTPRSIRAITVPKFLIDEIDGFISKRYDLGRDDRIFTIQKAVTRHTFHKFTDKADLPHIRIHDLRHSHASLLIDLGFSPVLIAERLGHENVKTTLNTYSHLFPNKQQEVADRLDALRR